MPIGLSDGTQLTSWVDAYVPQTSKEKSDAREMSFNETARSFENRFSAVEGQQGQSNLQATLLPSLKNNASTGSVEALRGLPEDVRLPDVGAPLIPDGGEFSPGDEGVNMFVKGASLWGKDVVERAYNALKLPGDVYSGKASPTDTARVMDLAGLMVMGPAPVASAMADGTLGSFVGVKSKTLNKENLYKAQNLELDGVHPDTIWKDTGMMRGADGRWKYEISDKEAKLKLDNLAVTPAKEIIPDPNAPKGWSTIGTEAPEATIKLPKDGIKLSEIYDHPKLYEAHPWLKNVDVVKDTAGNYGSYLPGQNKISMAEHSESQFKSTLAHEVQHAIQEYEGFGRGANPKQFKPQDYEEVLGMVKDFRKEVLSKKKEGTLTESDLQKMEALSRLENLAVFKPQKLYATSMGEIESANVQNRLNLSDFERKSLPPVYSEEFPRSVQHNPNGYGQGQASAPIIRPFKQEEFDAALKDIREGNDTKKHQAEQIIRGMAKDLLGNQNYQILHGLGKDLGLDKPKPKG